MSETDVDSSRICNPPRLPQWEPWLTLGLLAFGVNFVWEMLQAPLYAGMTSLPWLRGTVVCGTASLGDVVITLVAYGSAVLVLIWRGHRYVSARAWLLRPHTGRVALYLAVGIVVTVAVERYNVYATRRWAYVPGMPLVVGIGVAPIAQWLLVPLLVLWLAKKREQRYTSL